MSEQPPVIPESLKDTGPGWKVVKSHPQDGFKDWGDELLGVPSLPVPQEAGTDREQRAVGYVILAVLAFAALSVMLMLVLLAG